VDAQSGRQTSIHSLPFYSSRNGYKMRARLYLHGDGNARRTHMSLFFVLMRGPNDANLKFPFSHRVTFCLYDQTPQQRHIIDSFRPDIRSSSFQRPRSEMNIASGIPKFCRLDMMQQANNPYVRDDTMFIKVMVDFDDVPEELLPFVFSLNPGVPTHVQQRQIKEEEERRRTIELEEQSELDSAMFRTK
jgi:TNF receptor-associated factor 2